MTQRSEGTGGPPGPPSTRRTIRTTQIASPHILTMVALGGTNGNPASEGLRKLRQFGASISDDPALKGCGRRITIGVRGSAEEVLERTVRCRRNWLCATCGYAAACHESRKLGQRLLGWTAQGHAVALLTLTQCHCAGDGLAALWDRLEDAWAALARGSAWRADRKFYGARGYVRITEVVQHPLTGWNVHLHVLLLLDEELSGSDLAGLTASIAGRFVRGIRCNGGHAELSGQDLKPIRPGTEKRIATYCLKGNKRYWSKDGSRTPMAILSDLRVTGQGLPLWQEFTAAVTDTRRMQVVPSKAIDSLCRPEDTLLLDSGEFVRPLSLCAMDGGNVKLSPTQWLFERPWPSAYLRQYDLYPQVQGSTAEAP
jgi:Replication protein